MQKFDETFFEPPLKGASCGNCEHYHMSRCDGGETLCSSYKNIRAVDLVKLVQAAVGIGLFNLIVTFSIVVAILFGLI